MSRHTMNRRNFLLNSLYTGLLCGAGALPRVMSDAQAMGGAPLQQRILVNLLLEGGPNMRHLIVPAFESGQQTVGNKYWKNNWRMHRLPNGDNATLEQRWDDDYFKVTVGGSNWGNNVDSGGLNAGQSFGIWKEASWLIDMFLRGKVAIFSNAVGTRERDHQNGVTILENGFLDTPSSQTRFSGWGGRLASEAGGRAVSLTNLPSPFCFGQQGNDRRNVVVSDFISMHSSRQFGLFGSDQVVRTVLRNQKLANSVSAYYATLRAERSATDVQTRFLDQDAKVRQFSGLVNDRLAQAPEPLLIRALYDSRGPDGQPHNLNLPLGGGAGTRLLHLGDFGQQIRNLNDAILCNDILDLRVASMNVGGWDTHNQQRGLVPNGDINNVLVDRRIETRFKDIFGGPTTEFPNHLHGGFSALWASRPQADKDNIVISVAGEFGRQIRANTDLGTDHGEGNNMLLISERINGGLYGKLFPESEIALLDDSSVRTPAIKPETDIDHIFGAACDWVKGSTSSVFANRASAALESGVNLNNLFS